jgi:hypothetical protein
MPTVYKSFRHTSERVHANVVSRGLGLDISPSTQSAFRAHPSSAEVSQLSTGGRRGQGDVSHQRREQRT